VAEVFEWGSRVVKLYRASARKPTAFREAAIHAAVGAMALPVNQTIRAGIGGAAPTRRGAI
jgi:hypothetical protein